MGDKSGIEWTDATWNPVVGCSKVSPGCDNCYAIKMARRIEATGNEAYAGTTTKDDWTGLVKTLPERLDQPTRWRRPRRIFVNSMSDLFHPDVPDTFIAQVFNEMASNPRHQFQLLTKRPQRMAKWTRNVSTCEHGWLTHNGDNPSSYAGTGEIINDAQGWPLPNVWLGTSIETDKHTFRADHLRNTPAAIRFLSLEPLLGPLPSLNLKGIHGVVAGGESGPAARPMHPDWPRTLRDKCIEETVPFFFKQWGAWIPAHPTIADDIDDPNWTTVEISPDSLISYEVMYRAGKKASGRRLDGRTWDQYPWAEGGIFPSEGEILVPAGNYTSSPKGWVKDDGEPS